MRIAMIGQKGMPAHFGGVERHVHDLSEKLVERGFDVTVYARDWYTDISIKNYNGVNIKHVKTLKTKHFDTIVHTFFSTIDAMRSDIDVMHYHGVGPALLSWLPRIFSPQKKVITTFHSMDRKHKKWSFLPRVILLVGEWAACTFAHKTIAVSKIIQEYAKEVYDTSIDYIPNAVNTVSEKADETLLKKWKLKKHKYIICVSRLIPVKGVQYLIDAWIKIEPFRPKDMKLVIVGEGHYSDKYAQSLYKKAKGHKSIVFTGFQSDKSLHALFTYAFMQVNPSDHEGLPIAVLEGMNYGLPVLVSDISAHRILIHNYNFLPFVIF